MTKLFVIQESGDVVTLYEDNLPDLGKQKISRASHVEPDKTGSWQVKLSGHGLNRQAGVAGKVLCARKSRQEALEQEIKFIQERVL